MTNHGTSLTWRLALPFESEFAFQVRKAAMRPHIEKSRGWDEAEQREIHGERFAVHEFVIVSVGAVDAGIVVSARNADCVYLYQLFLLPEHQGRGIGAACMARIIDDADAAGLPVRLRVLRVNTRAVTFYERLQFAVASETEEHLIMERAAQRRG